ncbi:ABC transporter permease [Streptomyces sp. NPDC020801]|uniref:ABC transporter permease n=1 Tax=unclassified Streptomyces TaxID=2593676 RepID=UPI0037AAC67C
MSNRKSALVSSSFGLANAGVYYAFVSIVAVLSFLSADLGRPPYLAPANIGNLLDQTAVVAILVIFTTVVLISGNFDLSIGSVGALGAAVFLMAVPSLGLWGGLAVTLLVGAGVGLLNGVIVQLIGINAFIVTLGTMTAVRSLVLVLTNGRTIIISDGSGAKALQTLDGSALPTPNLWLVAGIVLLLAGGVRAVACRHRRAPLDRMVYVCISFGTAGTIASFFLSYSLSVTHQTIFLLVLGVGAGAVLRYTTVGRRLYAVGGNAEAARLSGIAVNRYKVVAFVLNGTVAAFAGALYAARLGSINPTGLTGFELTALAAAILGGTSLFGGSGTVAKSLVGALILFTLRNGFNVLNLGANWQGLIEGVVLIVAAGIYTVSGRRKSRQPARQGTQPQEPSPALTQSTLDATQATA